MADIINGTGTILYADFITPLTTDGEDVEVIGNFIPFVCLTDNGLDISVDQIDTSSKCSGIFKDSIPGQVGGTFTGNGNVKYIPVATTEASYQKVLEAAIARTVFWAGQFSEDLNFVQYAQVFISSLSNANPNNAASTFSITLQIKGEIFTAALTT